MRRARFHEEAHAAQHREWSVVFVVWMIAHRLPLIGHVLN